jgi:hypothetical protein
MSKRKIVGYNIFSLPCDASADETDRASAGVQKMMREGWEPYGYLIATSDAVFQAWVKHEEEEEEGELQCETCARYKADQPGGWCVYHSTTMRPVADTRSECEEYRIKP